MEERGRVERLENGAGGIGLKDTIGACATTGDAKRRNGTRKPKVTRDTYSSYATLT